LAGPTLIYQDDALRIYWHEDPHYYLSDWQPVFRKGEALKRAYQACLDAARARRGAVWLADASKMAVIDQSDQPWISEWFFPEFVKAGARYQASVVPEREVGKMSAFKAVEKAQVVGALSISVHKTRAEAEAAIRDWHEKHTKG
jgi:hypothetical protein